MTVSLRAVYVIALTVGILVAIMQPNAVAGLLAFVVGFTTSIFAASFLLAIVGGSWRT